MKVQKIFCCGNQNYSYLKKSKHPMRAQSSDAHGPSGGFGGGFQEVCPKFLLAEQNKFSL